MNNQLNPKEYPHLSQWDEKLLDKTLETLTKQANPSKTQITQEDKDWTATMLEMDLAHQYSSINEEEDYSEALKLIEHNTKVVQLEKWFKAGNYEEVKKIYLDDETSPKIKEMARIKLLILSDLPY